MPKTKKHKGFSFFSQKHPQNGLINVPVSNASYSLSASSLKWAQTVMSRGTVVQYSAIYGSGTFTPNDRTVIEQEYAVHLNLWKTCGIPVPEQIKNLYHGKKALKKLKG